MTSKGWIWNWHYPILTDPDLTGFRKKCKKKKTFEVVRSSPDETFDKYDIPGFWNRLSQYMAGTFLGVISRKISKF